MKGVLLAENIKCSGCNGAVRLTDAKSAGNDAQDSLRVEFHFVCVDCGTWGSSTQNGQYLPYSERKFCQDRKLEGFDQKVKGMGVVVNGVARRAARSPRVKSKSRVPVS